MKITFLDHYDSFSFNVLDWIHRASKIKLDIIRLTCDDETGLARLKNLPTPLIISPGPGSPHDYPKTLDLLNSLVTRVPILGICLGHQMLGTLAGGSINRAIDPWHGTQSTIKIIERNWFTENLPDFFQSTTYNSLIVDLEANGQPNWKTLAVDHHGQLMMMGHNFLPVASVQFHPESFNSTDLHFLAENFIKKCLNN